MNSIEEIADLAYDLLQEDSQRDKAFEGYRKQYHLKWELPEELEQLQWVRKAIVTDPHDSLEAARRLLGSGKVHVVFQPYLADDPNREYANMVERVLKWALANADARKRASTISELSKSALLYDAIALQVVDLEHQKKLFRNQKRDTRRLDNALRYGRFAVNVYNPMFVHAVSSSYGTEAVLLAQTRSAREVGHEWGNKKLIELGDETVTYYDYIDYDNRAVYVEYGTMGASSDRLVLIDPKSKDGKHDMPFFPWVALMGSSALEEEKEFQFHPMLFASHHSGAWETMNAMRTVVTSLGIARGGSPTIVETGMNPMSAEIDYMEPNRPIKAPPGNNISPFPAPPLDPGPSELNDRFGVELQRSTLGEVLRGGHLPSGVSFSALNLATQTAAAQLRPAKDLVERSLAEMFRLMMLWVEYTDVPLEGYNSEKRNPEYGKPYVIEPDEIDPSGLYITVTIDPEVPTDKLAKANTAIMLTNAGLLPKEYAMEEIGVDDPGTAQQLMADERYWDHQLNMMMQMEMQRAAAEQQLEMQQQQMQMEMEMQAQQQQMQQMQMMMQGGMGGMPAPTPEMPPEIMAQQPQGGGFEGQLAQMLQQLGAQQQAGQEAMMGPIPGGQGFNPAAGGMPPAMGTSPQMVNPISQEAGELGIPTGMEGL